MAFPWLHLTLLRAVKSKKMSEGFWERNYIVFMGTLLDVTLSLSVN